LFFGFIFWSESLNISENNIISCWSCQGSIVYYQVPWFCESCETRHNLWLKMWQQNFVPPPTLVHVCFGMYNDVS
jgi:hypothetical protein